MLVYIDDREDEELTDNYGYDYGCDDENYEYNSDSQNEAYDYEESSEGYFDE